MNAKKNNAVIVALTLAIGGLACQPATATKDFKSISPSECMPRGPGTTIGELTYGPYGITNPGTASESVLCSIAADSETGWSATAGSSASIDVYYRIGSAPGNFSCSAFTGTAGLFSPTYSTSASWGVQPAGTHDSVNLPLAELSGIYNIAPPVAVVCTLPPKGELVWIVLTEKLVTDTP